MQNFEGFGLSDDLNKSLAKMGYTTPTPVQAQAIPLALQGRDILGSAQTGTGKTAAFSIPLVEMVLSQPHGCAMVLTPTRELAKQVLDVIHQLLGPKSNINTAFIIGGDPMGKQISQLRARPRIIVGTPGRINDHLDRGTMKLDDTSFLVLDETDRMLDMGFGVQLDRIAEHLPQDRQTLMFSATLPNGIIAISKKYLNNPERISMGATNVVATNIKQEMIRIEQPNKYQELLAQLHDRQGSVIVFIKTKFGADKMAKNLRKDGFTSDALHGDLRQNKREQVMRNFRNMNFRVLVATDIAARGLDVPHIEHVVNYDLPQVAEDYIHRMGRTARAGAEGSAISFVSSQDVRNWSAIQRLLDPSAAANDQDHGPKKTQKSRGKPYRGRPSRDEKQGGEKRSFKAKPFKARSDDNRSEARSDKPYKAKPFKARGDDTRGEARSDKPYKAKSYSDKPRSDDNRGEARSDKPYKAKPFKARGDDNRGEARSDKPYKAKSYSDRPRSENGGEARSDKPYKAKPYSDKPRSENGGSKPPFKAKPYKGKSDDNRGGKPAGKATGKPAYKSAGSKPAGNKPFNKSGSFKKKAPQKRFA